MLRLVAGTTAVGDPISLWETTVKTFSYWATFGLLLAPLAAVVRRFPVERARWRHALALHCTLGVVFAVSHSLLTKLLADAFFLHRLPSFPALFRQLLRLTPMVDFFCYAVLVAATSALIYHHRYVAQERAASRHALRASELEASLAQARLETLRMQLNPHFLFNALNAASVLAQKGERDKVAAMLSRLADLLRAVLESSDQLVTLASEIELLERYLEIERVRFGDRLAARIEVDPALLDAEVPSLLLQPLAENAVRHGIARRPGPGQVEVRAYTAAGRLKIEVGDSGPGFADRGAPTPGIGLANTRARLEQLYGGDATLELAEAAGGGGLVLVDLPLRPWKEVAPCPSGR